MTERSKGDLMIRVYRLPEKLTNGFCFGGGNPIPFLNVDWFNACVPAADGWFEPTQEEIGAEVRRKRYYEPTARFLVLDDRPGRTFILDREAA